jgi:hypothetical protein
MKFVMFFFSWLDHTNKKDSEEREAVNSEAIKSFLLMKNVQLNPLKQPRNIADRIGNLPCHVTKIIINVPIDRR